MVLSFLFFLFLFLSLKVLLDVLLERLGRRRRRVASDDVALAVDEELGEVPLRMMMRFFFEVGREVDREGKKKKNTSSFFLFHRIAPDAL